MAKTWDMLIDWSSSKFPKQQRSEVAFGSAGSTCCDVGMGLALWIALVETHRPVKLKVAQTTITTTKHGKDLG